MRKSGQKYFFIISLILVFILVFLMFLPFMEVILLSAIFAIVLSPLHKGLTKLFRGKENISALLVLFLFALIIIVPVSFLTTQILIEAKGLYIQISGQSSFDDVYKFIDSIEKPIQNYYPSFSLDIKQYVGVVSDFIVGHLSTIVSGVFNIISSIILMFISLFFFLKDGSKFKKTLVVLSPMENEYDLMIFNKIKHTIMNTMKSVLLIAVMQGILAGIGMAIFGVPNATLWGTVSAIASLVPGLGTAIVFVPAIAYMFIVGKTFMAVGLLLWAALIVGLLDNFLGPYLYARGGEIHQLIMLFAVLGGLSFFGPLGFIFGPIIVSLLFSLIEIYQTIILKRNS